MPEESSLDRTLRLKIANQVDYIIASFAAHGIEIGVAMIDEGVDYMYAEGQLLVRDEFVDRVHGILYGDLPIDYGQVDRVIPGVALLSIAQQTPDGEQPTVQTALEMIDAQLGAGVATPNHVLTVSGVGGPCPATEPQTVYEGAEPYPSVCTGNGGEGVLVYVADTGLLEDAASHHPWLAGVQFASAVGGGLQGPDPLGPPGPDGTPTIPPYAGHGTFVAGVTRCMAPQADIIVANIFAIAGSALEADFARQLTDALDLGVDVFNLSISTGTRKDLSLLGFNGFRRQLRQYKGVVCVVAAGNNGSRHPSWPAAYPEMVSVGALGDDWRGRATFSNYGGWVDVYAPGRNLVNAFAAGRYTCEDAPYKGQVRKFYGMARWSGTSFSTPIVTGLIAARMSRTGENGQEAAAALLAQARSAAIPGVGAVLLPCGSGGGAGPVMAGEYG